ncbi:hypothetical protein ACWD5R_31150 [Streptomyces sp. NPDC002514]|uniref:hypothetical protein n=1 Tax=Streptomyces sp. NPDC001270 TaxID=3364554 RepID=UPI0036C48FAF
MDVMQRRLDADRDTLPATRDYVAQQQRNFGYDESQIALFTDAAGRLVELNEYRGRGIGWTEQDPAGNERFKQLRAYEQQDRAAVVSTLSGVIAYAESTRPDAPAAASGLRDHLARFESIPGQQDELHQARREYGEQITRSTVDAIPYRSNQIVDYARSGGQSYDLYAEYVTDDNYMLPVESEEMEAAQSAVIGARFGTGTCNEHSAYAFTEAMRTMPGTHVTMANVPGEHGMVIIGPPNRPESAHVDTWPLNPTVTSPETYGIDNIQEGFAVVEAVADGRDLRAEAQHHLEPLPERPAPIPPITLQEAAARMRAMDGIAELTHFITRTTDHRDSNSREQGRQYGLTLSREAFTATLANDFQIQSPPGSLSPAASQQRIASAIAAYSPSGVPGRDATYVQGSSAGPQHGRGRGGGVGSPPQPGPSGRRGR